MASKDLTDAAAYLTDAAHLMRTRAPQTSAHLMGYRNDLLAHQELSMSDAQRQRVCGACGNIHLPGDESTVRVVPRKASRAKSRPRDVAKQKPATRRGPIKIVLCGFCKRTTRTSLDAPGPAARSKSNRSAADKKTKASVPADAQRPAANANASSKKRAKNRKAGLQALLSGQQQQQSQSPLSLADFMK